MKSNIIPNWEWRTFGKSFNLNTDLDKCDHLRKIENSEIHIVSTLVDVDPKIQDNKLTIRSLYQVNSTGLEQWNSELNLSFPISIEELKEIVRNRTTER